MEQPGMEDDHGGFRALLEEAKERLAASRSLKPEQLTPNVDTVEVALVHLRDRLIEEIRAADGGRHGESFQKALHQTNLALSLVVGVVYPATGIQRTMIDEAEKVLDRIEIL